MPKPLPTNAATIYLRRWATRTDTYKTMYGALKKIAVVLSKDSSADPEKYPWHEIQYEDARGVAARLSESGRNGKSLAPATVNKSLVALRGVLESAWRSGQMPDEQYRRIEIENDNGVSEKAGRALENEEIDQLLDALTRATVPNAALVGLMYGCGLRRVEIERLMQKDYDFDAKEITAKGKRNKIREIPVPDDVRVFIETHWRTLQPGTRAFGGTRRESSLVVERFCKEMELPLFTAHDLRRSYATRLLDQGADIAIVARLMGHSSIDVTKIYDRRGKSAEQAAVKLLNRTPDK